MLKKLLLAASLAFPFVSTACDSGGFTVPSKDLEPGGVFVSYINGCSKGCDQLKRGDLIQAVDGQAVATRKELLSHPLTDGKPHKLKVYQKSTKAVAEIEIVAEPNNSLPPLKDAPPFWTVGAANLNKAPAANWARRRLFGHAMPQIVWANIDGGFIDGRSFHGKKHVVAIFDWAAATDRENGGVFLKVLQKAQADLKRSGFEIVFAQMAFPSERQRPPMNDTDLRDFFNKNQLDERSGGPLPPPPMYRPPNATEDKPALWVGMEGAFAVPEAMGEAPVIMVVDEGGIIRWHSAGLTTDPAGKLPDVVYTINEAVMFAMKKMASE